MPFQVAIDRVTQDAVERRLMMAIEIYVLHDFHPLRSRGPSISQSDDRAVSMNKPDDMAAIGGDALHEQDGEQADASEEGTVCTTRIRQIIGREMRNIHRVALCGSMRCTLDGLGFCAYWRKLPRIDRNAVGERSSA
jgi:hypothetical protein